MATRIYIAIFLILHSHIGFAVSAANRVAEIPQIRDPKKSTKKKGRELLIRSIRPPKWADFDINGKDKNGQGSGDGEGADGSAEGFGNGEGRDGGGNNGYGGANGIVGKGQIGIDENAKGNPAADPGEKDRPVTPPGNPPGGGGPKGDAKALTYWIPMCFFFDGIRSSDQGNEIVKDLVDAYAACDIVVEAFPMGIQSNYPDDPDTVNKMAEAACPANQAFGVKGSAAQTHVRFNTTSDLMCKSIKDDGKGNQVPTTEVAGCSVVGNGAGGGSGPLSPAGQKFDSGGNGKSGVPATSIVDGDIPDPGVAIHETGHSVGGPGQGGDYLVNEGEGIGKPRPPSAGFGLQLQSSKGAALKVPGKRFHAHPEGTSLEGSSFTQPHGCASLRGGSNLNDGTHKWSKSRNMYYRRPEAPGGFWDLMNGKSIFGERKGIPVGVAATEPNQPPTITRGDLPPGEKPSGTRQGKSDDLVLANGVNGGHKKPKLGGPKSIPKSISESKSNPPIGPIAAGESPLDIVPPASAKDSAPTIRDETILDKKPSGEGEIQKGGPTATIRMDEARQANDASVGASSTNQDFRSPAGGDASGNGNSGGIRMDENASGREEAVSMGLSGEGVGYDAIAGIGFDSEEFTNGLSRDFFKKKKTEKDRKSKRGEGLRRGGGSLRRPASTDVTKTYEGIGLGE